MKFSEFTFETSLQSAIDQLGYTEATPIQDATIPLVLEGKDLSGLAQTGTGKTAAFLLPLMERILRARTPAAELSDEEKALNEKRAFPDWRAQNFILILVPTRELCEQVYENITKLSQTSGLRGIAVYGGTAYDKQKEAFKMGVEFVVATPGRLIDLYKEHFVDLKQVRAIVFDEADRMFDMGFKDDMKFILGRVPKERQFLVFSATLNFDVLNTAYQFGADPVEINVSRDQTRAENVKDCIFHVAQDDKPQYLVSLLRREKPKQAIIFSNFKMNVERISGYLSANDLPAMAISSLLSQAQRNRVIETFKLENEQNILVATDVAARGLDIKGVDLVINFELPQDAESYVHRIGRTGRAGAEGKAFSLVSDRDIESLERIEEYLKHKLEIGWIEETDIVKDLNAAPNEGRDSRPPRRDDRAPRSGGGDRSGGPRRDRDARPPRAGGAERDRGPRAAGAGPGRGPARGPRQDRPHDGPAGESPREGRRHEGGPRRHDGPRAEGRPPQNRGNGGPRGPRHEGAAAASENGSAHKNAAPRKQHKHQPPQKNAGARAGHKPPPPAAKGIGSKVGGFFKKLFGG